MDLEKIITALRQRHAVVVETILTLERKYSKSAAVTAGDARNTKRRVRVQGQRAMSTTRNQT